MSANSRRAPPVASWRAVGRVRFKHELHLWPTRRNGVLPVTLERVADRAQQPQGRAVVGTRGGLQPVRHWIGRVSGHQVAAHDLGRGGSHRSQLVVEAGDELRRTRRQEVGEGAARVSAKVGWEPTRPHEREKQVGVGRAEAPADRAQPGQVQRVAARVRQRPQAEHGFSQRRDPKPSVLQVLDAEFESDHLAIRYIHWRRAVPRLN
jgi:hypothetical protein